MGVPLIGCRCAVCQSPSPYNKRWRSSALLQIADKKLLIDAGPDFRAQALRFGIEQLDGLLLTHQHNDHTAGLDELRILTKRQGPLPCLLSRETFHELRVRFAYIFDPDGLSLVTRLDPQLFPAPRGTALCAGIPFSYFSYSQLGVAVNGFRFGELAYISDICDYPDTLMEDLQGVRLLILSALRYLPSPLHFSVDQAVAFARQVGAKHTWLTHMAHELEHEETNRYLPPEVRMGYDGLSIDFSLEMA